MSCSYDDCGDYQVTPVLMAPCDSMPCCDGPALCYPCLPRCPKGQIVYCCERKPCRPPKDECCYQTKKTKSNDRQRDPERDCSPNHCCPPCKHTTCNPVKTKYVIPCYRYEDGRIEQYMPTRHGRLPVSAYRRNGMQDQMHGYRGAIRYLCAGGHDSYMPCVYTAVEPIRKLFPRITQEVNPMPSSALKRNGLQDQKFIESGGIAYVRKCWRNAQWSDYPFAFAVKPAKKLPVKVQKLPVSAFKRNGMQDQEHSKLLGTTNFLKRCPRDVMIECDVCTQPVKLNDPVKVPELQKSELCCRVFKKRPIEVNQPTVLTRRACEVAVGCRPRRKPFFEHSYCADAEQQIHRYVSEDERTTRWPKCETKSNEIGRFGKICNKTSMN
ncbi:unnamed protein product [Pieris brassicae]|uniref:Uncharacterized protein n=1 Tax=Pieris brassicae TaxID=7116 RepID=A0A9P0TIJ9_PIEBR|nr:unnamed protein product [Pieris brassicae]